MTGFLLEFMLLLQQERLNWCQSLESVFVTFSTPFIRYFVDMGEIDKFHSHSGLDLTFAEK